MSKKKADRTERLSIRVSELERAWLEKQAGRLALSEYIRHRIFGQNNATIKTSGKIRPKRVKAEKQALAKVLALLGQTSVFQHLDDLANAARSGSLHVSPEIERVIHKVQADIATIKSLLMKALGTKEQ